MSDVAEVTREELELEIQELRTNTNVIRCGELTRELKNIEKKLSDANARVLKLEEQLSDQGVDRLKNDRARLEKELNKERNQIKSLEAELERLRELRAEDLRSFNKGLDEAASETRKYRESLTKTVGLLELANRQNEKVVGIANTFEKNASRARWTGWIVVMAALVSLVLGMQFWQKSFRNELTLELMNANANAFNAKTELDVALAENKKLERKSRLEIEQTKLSLLDIKVKSLSVETEMLKAKEATNTTLQQLSSLQSTLQRISEGCTDITLITPDGKNLCTFRITGVFGETQEKPAQQQVFASIISNALWHRLTVVGKRTISQEKGGGPNDESLEVILTGDRGESDTYKNLADALNAFLGDAGLHYIQSQFPVGFGFVFQITGSERPINQQIQVQGGCILTKEGFANYDKRDKG